MLFTFFKNAIWFVTALGAVGGVLAMTALFAAGLIEIFYGACAFVWYFMFPASEAPTYAEMITRVIHGVELLLIAPVAFLIFSALNKYLADFDHEKRGPQAHVALMRVKSFVMGLLFALIATSAVGRVLKGDLSLADAAGTSLLLVVIGLFFYALERIAMERPTADTTSAGGHG